MKIVSRPLSVVGCQLLVAERRRMDRTKSELAAVLLELNEVHPNWRFGQLVANVAAWAGTDEPANIWELSDADLLQAAREHLLGQTTSATNA
ncbi:MAG TPA: hypothetical protein VFC78_06170 [Tepidisphaeraceae bacterium]|nr:hypothetical protein [Tepidisphaeraceae bacterium]